MLGGHSRGLVYPTLVAAAAILSGCAAPRVAVVEQGDRTAALASSPAFRISPGGLAVGTALEDDFRRRLTDHGLGEGSPPRLIFDISLSVRPVQVGAYGGAEVPPRDAPDAWLAPPGRRAWWAPGPALFCTLEIQGIDASSGHEVYGVRAQMRRRGGDCAKAWPILLDRALADGPGGRGISTPK